VVRLTIGLDPAVVLTLPALDGIPRVKFLVSHDGGKLTVDVAAKAVRKAQTAIRNAGAEENVFVMLQGKLVRGEILEAGLVVQAKPKQ
jgi:hypothetical protein